MGIGRRLGLIIGVNHYQDAAFRPLHFAESDAKILGQWLVNTQGGNWAPSDVQIVLGGQATRELVESLIMQVCLTMAGPDDIILFYFAGHAYLDETNGEGYLAFANTTYQQSASGLHLPSLMRKAMGSSRAASILCVLDCFQNGFAWSKQRTSPYDAKPLLGSFLLTALNQVSDRLLFCSCRGNELAPESGEKNVGHLIHRMIVGLCGQASDPATGRITLLRLYAFLTTVVDEQHQPQVFGQELRPFVLVGDMGSPVSSTQNRQGTLPQPFEVAAVDSNYGLRQQTVSEQLRAEATYAMSALAQTSPKNSGLLSFQASPATSNSLPLQMSPAMANELSPQLSHTNSGVYPPQESQHYAGQPAYPGGEQQRQQHSIMLLSQARELVQMQKLGEALNQVEQVLQLTPTYIDALILKGQLLGASGRFQEALLVVDRIIQLEGNNALAWSMRAALLTNMGQYQDALSAADHSLAIDPHNSETLNIKETIQIHLAKLQHYRNGQQFQSKASLRKKGGNVITFFCIQVLALMLGVAGAFLPIIVPQLPIVVAFVLQSFALAILCVNAARSSYLYGFTRMLLTVLVCGITAGILGAIYKLGFNHFEATAIAHPTLLVPILFLALWLVLAIAAPLIATIAGFIGGLLGGPRRQQ